MTQVLHFFCILTSLNILTTVWYYFYLYRINSNKTEIYMVILLLGILWSTFKTYFLYIVTFKYFLNIQIVIIVLVDTSGRHVFVLLLL